MNNTYKTNLLSLSSKLDALTDSCGKIIKHATAVTEENSEDSTYALVKSIAEIVGNNKYSSEIKKVAASLKDALIRYHGYILVSRICDKEKNENTDNRTLPELLNELHALVGLDNVKSKVNDLIIYQKIQKMRRDNNLHTTKSTLHLAFTGNPGTGKTTVARIVGRIYKQIGLLSKGHFIEVSRTDLIAGYQGQTALKVKKVIDRAKGGVLFIDEAYCITENDHIDSYGRECLTELTKALEDYRDDLVVIVAGYTEPMNKFFESNSGLKSRFNTFIEFHDYSSNEMLDILIMMCKNNDYRLSEEAEAKIKLTFDKQISNKSDNFANGRFVRNIYENLIMNHARRVIDIDNPDAETLSLIIADDFIVSENPTS